MREISELIRRNKKRPLVIGIDGMCASGKTTLAESLSKDLNAQVIHTDDFFIPKAEYRGLERINIDKARFVSEVIRPMSEGAEFSYGVFDCRQQKISARRKIGISEFYIIEGSYCLHPCLPDIFDIKVFLTVPPALQRARLIEREGPDNAAVFEDRWIPLENKYFEEYAVKERCDIVL